MPTSLVDFFADEFIRTEGKRKGRTRQRGGLRVGMRKLLFFEEKIKIMIIRSGSPRAGRIGQVIRKEAVP
jgi:hypothetical protein